MSEENKVDVALEQVGLLIADEDYQRAGALLKVVLGEGDDAQREMAELYVMQLQETAPHAVKSLSEDSEDSQDTGVVEPAREPKPTPSKAEKIDIALEKLGEMVAAGELERGKLLADKIATSGDDAQREMATVYQLQIDEMLAAQNLVERKVEPEPITPESAQVAATEEPQDEGSENFALSAPESEFKEHEVALEQAMMLIEAGDSETAGILLEPVLQHGSDEQKLKALKYLEANANKSLSKSIAEDNVVNTEVVTENDSDSLEQKPAAVSDVAATSHLIKNEEFDESVSSSSAFEQPLSEHAETAQSRVQNTEENPFSSGDIFGINQPDYGLSTLTYTHHTKSFETSSEASIADSVAQQFDRTNNTENLLNPLDALQTDISFVEKNLLASERFESQQDVEKRQGFFVGNVGLMINYIDGSQLVEMPDVYQLPSAPNWFKGVANINGNIIPVFDLVEYFGFSRTTLKKPMLLVLSHDANATGVIIDGLPNRLEWSGEQEVERNNAPDLLIEHIHTACMIDESLWFDLDVNSLCDALENGLAA